MKRPDSDLRRERLVFYEADMAELHSELDAFLELSKARCAMLIDRDGSILATHLRGSALESSLRGIFGE